MKLVYGFVVLCMLSACATNEKKLNETHFPLEGGWVGDFLISSLEPSEEFKTYKKKLYMMSCGGGIKFLLSHGDNDREFHVVYDQAELYARLNGYRLVEVLNKNTSRPPQDWRIYIDSDEYAHVQWSAFWLELNPMFELGNTMNDFSGIGALRRFSYECILSDKYN